MSVHRPFDALNSSGIGLPRHNFGPHRSQSQHLVEILAGGLQTAYQAEPETEMSQAFTDLIARLRRAEEVTR